MASSPAASQQPDNRFARFSPDDHSAPIWIASLLALSFAYIILIIRLLFVKWNMHGADDVLLTLAHLVGLGMWAALFSSLNNGLGKTVTLLSPPELSRMNRGYYASRILLYLALCLSKCSVLVFIRSIFHHKKGVGPIVNVTGTIVVVWGLASVLAVSVACPPDLVASDRDVSNCASDVLRLEAVTVVDVITEVVIFLLPVVPLLMIQMRWKRKALVMFAFSFRLPNILTSIMHILRYRRFIHDGHPSLAIFEPIVWQNALLSYSFMSATIPALKGFMTQFLTRGMFITPTSTGQGSSGNSYQMLSLNKSNAKDKDRERERDRDRDRSPPQATDEVDLLPEGYPASMAVITSAPGESSKTKRRPTAASESIVDTDSIATQDSQKIIIRKDWRISRA